MSLVKILAEVGTKVSYLQKQGKVEAGGSGPKYKYARAEDVFQAVTEALYPRGVAVIDSKAELLSLITLEDPEKKKRPMVHAVVRITQTYKHAETGETATFQGLGSGADMGDKAVMKANTAALKYLHTDAFNISWGDDPEATDAETGKTTSAKRANKAKAASGEDTSAAIEADMRAAKDKNSLELIKPRIGAIRTSNPTEYERLKSMLIVMRNEFVPAEDKN